MSKKMNKKEMIERLTELKVEFNPDALKSELENILAAAEKEAGQAGPGPGAPKPEAERKTGKITKEDLKNITCLRPGYKAVRMSREEANQLQCWYDPKAGIGVIKG